MASTAEKIRAYNGPAFLSRGFRPFFLGAAIFAGLAMPLWSLMLAFDIALPGQLAGREWHLHEMLFGYMGAIMAGFLLTAVPNWTGRLPVLGLPLAALFSLWGAGRIAMLFWQFTPVLSAILDGAFLALFAALLVREIWAGNNRKNLPVAGIVSLFAASNIAFDVLWLTGASTDLTERLALGLVAMLLSLIGGRITPSFTRNWMAKNKLSPLPAPMDTLDHAAMAIGVIAILFWIFLPQSQITGAVFVLAALAYLARLSRWRGWRAFGEPLVLILHIGYLWLPVWFILMALQIWDASLIDTASALHALSAGAIGTMTMAVATRATLGHSGQPLSARPATTLIYVLVISGALLRIIANWLPFDFFMTTSIAGTLWAAGMIVFVFAFGPLLLGRRKNS